jgi:hypothetical protein
VTGGLFTDIDGQTVPLADCDWVLFAPCGCPDGCMCASGSVAEDRIWAEFYPRKRDRAAARSDGYRMVLMTPARWAAEVMPAMRDGNCPHNPPQPPAG